MAKRKNKSKNDSEKAKKAILTFSLVGLGGLVIYYLTQKDKILNEIATQTAQGQTQTQGGGQTNQPQHVQA